MRIQTALHSFLKPKPKIVLPSPKRAQQQSKTPPKAPQKTLDTATELRRYKLIFEKEPVGLIITEGGRIQSVNYAMRVFLNAAQEDLIGKMMWYIFPVRREMRTVVTSADKMIQQHIPGWQTYATLTDSTKTVQMYQIQTILLNKNISKPLVCWVFQNISDKAETILLKENNTQLLHRVNKAETLVKELITARDTAQAANKSKTDFLANISHEMRTPLNAILGFAETIASETFGPIQNEQYRTYINYITRSGQHLLSLVNDILDLAGLEAGKQMVETTVPLHPLLQDTLVQISRYPDAPNRHISLAMPDKDILLKADERALRQIFLNLLSNAIKFTKEGGQIRIGVTRLLNGGIKISVKDNGIGVPKNKIKQLFQPFTQIENAITRTQTGSGLGLVLVKKLVLLHDGSIEMKSKSGAGTNILVEFPAERVIK